MAKCSILSLEILWTALQSPSAEGPLLPSPGYVGRLGWRYCSPRGGASSAMITSCCLQPLCWMHGQMCSHWQGDREFPDAHGRDSWLHHRLFKSVRWVRKEVATFSLASSALASPCQANGSCMPLLSCSTPLPVLCLLHAILGPSLSLLSLFLFIFHFFSLLHSSVLWLADVVAHGGKGKTEWPDDPVH